MKRIYVAGPYSADNVITVLQNIGYGEYVCADLFLQGFAPFCPWHDKSYAISLWATDFDVQQFYDYCIAWLEVSDAMLVIGDWQTSKGTLTEIEVAMSKNIPVFYSIPSLYAWAKTQG